jgi:hypothetical protein
MTSIAWLAVAALAAAPPVPQVRLVSHLGQTGGGSAQHPQVEWQGTALTVRVGAYVTATRSISDQPPGLRIDGDQLQLCYGVETHPLPAGQMAPLWARPVLLEFTVSGLPKQTYAVTVADHCP